MKNFDYEQMMAGKLYLASDLPPEQSVLPGIGDMRGKLLTQQINQVPLNDFDEIVRLEGELVGSHGKSYFIHPPLYVDFGSHLHLGENFYCNVDPIFIDVNTITFGDNVMIGPRVGFYTAGHPTDAAIRNSGLEFGLPITVGDNVWICAQATILPGVTIGKNSIVAAGAVVTKDVPENVLVGGNPARVIRELGEADKQKWAAQQAAYHKAKEQFQGK